MDSKIYLKKQLEQFIKLFPQTKVRYEFDESICTHFVEVLPSQFYYENQSFIEWENKFFKEFIIEYPNQNIGFITDDAIISLDAVIYEETGCNYLKSKFVEEFQ